MSHSLKTLVTSLGYQQLDNHHLYDVYICLAPQGCEIKKGATDMQEATQLLMVIARKYLRLHDPAVLGTVEQAENSPVLPETLLPVGAHTHAPD